MTNLEPLTIKLLPQKMGKRMLEQAGITSEQGEG